MTSSVGTSCTIPVATLITSPYSLPWGSSVYAKVLANNFYGDSDESLEGNGAIIITTPDAPINLQEDYSQRTKSILAITWDDASFTGGDAIIDYRISIQEENGAYQVLQANHIDKSYTATGLQFGVTYSFKVESRNSYSYSAFSEIITLLCAFKPDPPLLVTTANNNDLVTVSWDDPIANGYVIHEYKIYIR